MFIVPPRGLSLKVGTEGRGDSDVANLEQGAPRNCAGYYALRAVSSTTSTLSSMPKLAPTNWTSQRGVKEVMA
jgi:hypothetical protein